MRLGSTTRCLHICRSIEEFRKYRKALGVKTLGFVPTMGALHDGHISLVKKAKEECDIVAASIFVNPTQFGPHEDLDKYPRTLERDLHMLTLAQVDCVFVPDDNKVMYDDKPLVRVEPPAFSAIFEGVARPDFFRGVATIVCKLFNIITPTHAYFGQKDISQCILIKRMVHDLNFPIHIRVCETLRATDGLALSSRNAYLMAHERERASILYKALNASKIYIENAKSEVTRQAIIQECERVLRSEELVTHIEYISVASSWDMVELDSIGPHGQGCVISSALHIGSVRLIDNLLVGRAADLIYDST
jgi:pantoate--beta-alanine ligase